MSAIQKERRALSDAPYTLSTQPQVPHMTGEQKQGKQGVPCRMTSDFCRGQNDYDIELCFTFHSYLLYV